MEELRIREQWALSVVNEIKVNNQYLFTENRQVLKENETLQVHNSWLESVVVEACKTVPELHIPKDAQPEAKIWKLVVGAQG